MQQPPVKKIGSDSAIGMMPINSMQVDMQVAVADFSISIGGFNIGVSLELIILARNKIRTRKNN